MVVFGLLRGGRALRFVSNAVMKGFLNGVAVLVIVGQFANITGYGADGATKLEKSVETLVNIPNWDFTTLAVGLITVAFILVMKRTRLKDFALLIALVVVTTGVYVLGTEVALVKSVSAIPSASSADRASWRARSASRRSSSATRASVATSARRRGCR